MSHKLQMRRRRDEFEMQYAGPQVILLIARRARRGTLFMFCEQLVTGLQITSHWSWLRPEAGIVVQLVPGSFDVRQMSRLYSILLRGTRECSSRQVPVPCWQLPCLSNAGLRRRKTAQVVPSTTIRYSSSSPRVESADTQFTEVKAISETEDVGVMDTLLKAVRKSTCYALEYMSSSLLLSGARSNPAYRK